MWLKLSLLLLLIFCSCNVLSKNLRKSLNQNIGDNGLMEDSLYPTAASDIKFNDGFYNGYGGELRGRQHHVSIDDDQQHINALTEIQHNGYNGNKETPSKKNNDDSLSNNDKFGKQNHGRFRRGYYYYSTSTISNKTITVWGFGMIFVVFILPLLFCCCIGGLISLAIYAVVKHNRHDQPGVVYQQ